MQSAWNDIGSMKIERNALQLHNVCASNGKQVQYDKSQIEHNIQSENLKNLKLSEIKSQNAWNYENLKIQKQIKNLKIWKSENCSNNMKLIL